MGTRSGAKLKLRNAPYKCDMCGRRLMSAEALKSHLDCVHNVTAKVKTKTAPVKQAGSKAKNQTLKTKNMKIDSIIKVKSAPPKKDLTSTKTAAKAPEKKTPVEASSKPKPGDVANVEYECPECMKIFPFYFSAHRHIQKCHCINSAGEKVSPNSKSLIKPLMKELCSNCNKRLSSEPHACTNVKVEFADLGPTMNYVCSGCKQQFLSLRLFDLHVAGLHCDGVESMFFPTIDEFQIWKDEMELQTKVTFAILGKYNSKKMYRCTFLPDGGNTYDDNTSLFCPCTIVVQEYSKGIQVHFYKDHHGHACSKYILSEKYKKYSLTTLLQNAEAYTQIDELKIDENDLYLQFKKLMECIIFDAAKINIETLKVLIGKALDMTSVLNNYEEDPESDSMSGKRLIEDKITWVLGELENRVGGKRKLGLQVKSNVEPITKRFKTRTYQDNTSIEAPAACLTDTSSPGAQDTSIKIINSFSLAQPEISQVLNEADSENEVDTLSRINNLPEKDSTKLSTIVRDKDMMDDLAKELLKVKEKKLDQALSSFNDSYKDFVVKNFKVDPQSPTEKSNESNSSNETSQSPTPVSSPNTQLFNTPNLANETKSIENSNKSDNLKKPLKTYRNVTKLSENSFVSPKHQLSSKTKSPENESSLLKKLSPSKQLQSETDLSTSKTKEPRKPSLLEATLLKPLGKEKTRYSEAGLNLSKAPLQYKRRHSTAGVNLQKFSVPNKSLSSEFDVNWSKPLVPGKIKADTTVKLPRTPMPNKTKPEFGVKLPKTPISGKGKSDTGIKSHRTPITTTLSNKSRTSNTGLLKPLQSSKARSSDSIKYSKSPLLKKTKVSDSKSPLLVSKSKSSVTSVKLPKTPSSSKTKLSNLNSPKPLDIKYEVKERENDCNILILKF